ncbi:serine protease [Brevibacillus dissolubilis]|uniref:serine protease n=1 Tax=Brevibacillus dissolubilis TaxID=1844116 RepID=UPI0011160964|nr:serine protease [Brevibacillus dissolubilis]
MNYFILLQDNRISDAIEPVGVSKVLTRELLDEENAHELEAMNLQFFIKDKAKNEYVDYLQTPAPLLSDPLKQLLQKYDKHTYFQSVVLTDLKKMRQETYWLMLPPKVDCMSLQSEFHKDGTLRRLVIDEHKAKAVSHRIFQVDGIRETCIIINLAVAESLLRRDFTGIRLIQAEKQSQVTPERG